MVPEGGVPPGIVVALRDRDDLRVTGLCDRPLRPVRPHSTGAPISIRPCSSGGNIGANAISHRCPSGSAK